MLKKFKEKELGAGYEFTIINENGAKISYFVPKLSKDVLKEWQSIKDMYLDLQQSQYENSAILYGFTIGQKDSESICFDVYVRIHNCIYKAKSQSMIPKKTTNKIDETSEVIDLNKILNSIYEYILTVFSDTLLNGINDMVKTQISIFDNNLK